AGPEEALAAALVALHGRLHPGRSGDETEIAPFRPAPHGQTPHGATAQTHGPTPRGERPPPRADRTHPQARSGPTARPGGERPAAGKSVRLFVGLGRAGGLRAADLVGAIANEAKVPAKEIGAIVIADRHSLVDVPIAHADAVIQALRATTLRGRKVRVDRDRGLGGTRPS
ncbi:MAG: DbpA RNA binding domain-containing protein, partial [Deltaproteobacteria bacterium]